MHLRLEARIGGMSLGRLGTSPRPQPSCFCTCFTRLWLWPSRLMVRDTSFSLAPASVLPTSCS